MTSWTTKKKKKLNSSSRRSTTRRIEWRRWCLGKSTKFQALYYFVFENKSLLISARTDAIREMRRWLNRSLLELFGNTTTFGCFCCLEGPGGRWWLLPAESLSLIAEHEQSRCSFWFHWFDSVSLSRQFTRPDCWPLDRGPFPFLPNINCISHTPHSLVIACVYYTVRYWYYIVTLR